MSTDARQPLLPQPPGPRWSRSALWPFGPIVAKLLALVAAAVLILGGALSWWVSHTVQQQTLARAIPLQADAVDLVARLLAARLDQQQKLAQTLAQGLLSRNLDPAWLLAQRGSASLLNLFDGLLLADMQGRPLLQLGGSRLEPYTQAQPEMLALARQSLSEGKPMLMAQAHKGSEPGQMDIVHAMPLRLEGGEVGGALLLSSHMSTQPLLPPSTEAANAHSRFLVLARDGQVLAPVENGSRFAGLASEPGLGGDWPSSVATRAMQTRVMSEQRDGYLVTSVGMPLPQWLVVKITPMERLVPGLSQREQWQIALILLVAAVVLVLALVFLTHPWSTLFRRARLWLAGDSHALAGMARVQTEGAVWPASWGEAGVLWQVLQKLELQGGELRRSLDQLQALVDHAPLGLLVTREGRLDQVGLQAARMLGYQPQELLGQHLSLLCLSGEMHANLQEQVSKDLKMYGHFDSEHRFLRKNGSPVWVRMHGRSMQSLQRSARPLAAAAGDSSLVWVVEDVTVQRMARGQPGWKALHDPLTCLPNREAFLLHLHDWLQECAFADAQAQAQARGDGVSMQSPGILLYLDLDHFAHVNQKDGHEAGDLMLCHMATTIDSVVRPHGWVARLGGDEFAVLLADVSGEQGMGLAQSLCMAVQNWRGLHEGQPYLMGVSIGMVVLDASLHTAASALRAADMACYTAKRRGRGCVELHSLHS
ncbi:sensor domain-containing diguanylate cyclase [Comamonas composti]|uniref:sensor domain-containing diguanylate cyclase n=1 Tax=Comamonas composti TaxID=408558 RepID=UPI0004144699|nr:diguanylate cyclase [Comamonas composti]